MFQYWPTKVEDPSQAWNIIQPIPSLEYNPCRADMVKPNVKKIYTLKMIFKVLDPRRRPCRSYDPSLNIYKKRTKEKEKGIQDLTLRNYTQYTCTLLSLIIPNSPLLYQIIIIIKHLLSTQNHQYTFTLSISCLLHTLPLP